MITNSENTFIDTSYILNALQRSKDLLQRTFFWRHPPDLWGKIRDQGLGKYNLHLPPPYCFGTTQVIAYVRWLPLTDWWPPLQSLVDRLPRFSIDWRKRTEQTTGRLKNQLQCIQKNVHVRQQITIDCFLLDFKLNFSLFSNRNPRCLRQRYAIVKMNPGK